MLKTTVLIVEDEALIAEELRDRLEQLGHTVADVVDTAEAAVAAARRHSPGLILMDIRLKGEEDGIDAATVIGQHAAVPIVFMTAHSDADTIERAMLTRPFGYVVKPVRDADLVVAVQTALIRHAAEHRLRASAARSTSILDNSADLIVELLPDGRLLSVNAAGRLTLGYSQSQIARLRLTDLVADGDKDAVAKTVWSAAASEALTDISVTLLTRERCEIPATGVVGRNRPGGQVERLWVVFRPSGEHPGAPDDELCPSEGA